MRQPTRTHRPSPFRGSPLVGGVGRSSKRPIRRSLGRERRSAILHSVVHTTAGRAQVAALSGLFILAVAIGLELARPFSSASIAFDSQVAVLHFERIVGGQRLEAAVSTTPKPLLTLIFGPLHALTGDWRPLAWVTIGAFGVAIAGVGALVGRVAGPVAAAFSAVAVLAAPTLLFDVGYALATPFALVGWVAAGLAVTGPRPRYAIAGTALLLATLARIETLVLIGLIAVVLAIVARIGGPAPRRAWLVPSIGAAALVVMGIHDWLLTGDPLFWSTVAVRYSEATQLEVPSPVRVIAILAGRYADFGAISLLALIGVVRLVIMRQYALIVGLAGLGPGIAAFLIYLAVRGIYVSERYFAAIDVAVLVASGIGIAGLALDIATLTSTWRRRISPGAWRATSIAAAFAAAVILVWPHGPLDIGLRKQVRTSLEAAVDADRAAPVIAARLAAANSSPSPAVLVPTSVRPRLVIDLGLSLTAVGGTDGLTVDPRSGVPARGQIIDHDRRAERRPDTLAALEIDRPVTLGDLRLEPLLADPARGTWIIAVR